MGFGQVCVCLGNVLLLTLILAQLSAVRLLLLNLYIQCLLSLKFQSYT